MLGVPYIPENITVHLGKPDEDAPNVTVPFATYIKNVASSEIYPTWPDNAIRANVYAIATYVLNRIYTEYYRSKGYDFDVTNSTQFDQAFVPGRDIFEPISRIVDELFNDYVVKQGSVEPFFTAFCNGTTSTCPGLSQWGTVDLANRGFTPYDILKYYYGDDINIVKDADVRMNTPSYPDEPLSLGQASNNVKNIQVQLNRIATDYPAIPKIYPVDGVFGVETENAVKEFQKIFDLPRTGIIDKATWYKIGYIFTSVKKLSELSSEGISLQDISQQFVGEIKPGDTGKAVRIVQYYLSVIGAYYDAVSPAEVTGVYDAQTENSVKSFQKVFGLPETGIIDQATWNDMYRAYSGIVKNVPVNFGSETIVLFPGINLKEGITSDYVKILQQYLTYINQTYPSIPPVNNTGYFGPMTKASVTAFQKEFGIEPANGIVGAVTWSAIADVYSNLRYGEIKRPEQFPGFTIKEDK